MSYLVTVICYKSERLIFIYIFILLLKLKMKQHIHRNLHHKLT